MSFDQSKLKEILLDVAKLKRDAANLMALASKTEKAIRTILIYSDREGMLYTENPMLYFIHNSNSIVSDSRGSISVDDLTQLFNSYYTGEEWSKKMVRIEVSRLGFESVRVGTKRGVKGLVRKLIHTSETRH